MMWDMSMEPNPTAQIMRISPPSAEFRSCCMKPWEGLSPFSNPNSARAGLGLSNLKELNGFIF